jgi:hypothetical protein
MIFVMIIRRAAKVEASMMVSFGTSRESGRLYIGNSNFTEVLKAIVYPRTDLNHSVSLKWTIITSL